MTGAIGRSGVRGEDQEVPDASASALGVKGGGSPWCLGGCRSRDRGQQNDENGGGAKGKAAAEKAAMRGAGGVTKREKIGPQRSIRVFDGRGAVHQSRGIVVKPEMAATTRPTQLANLLTSDHRTVAGGRRKKGEKGVQVSYLGLNCDYGTGKGSRR